MCLRSFKNEPACAASSVLRRVPVPKRSMTLPDEPTALLVHLNNRVLLRADE
jgi:hypothetical protein